MARKPPRSRRWKLGLAAATIAAGIGLHQLTKNTGHRGQIIQPPTRTELDERRRQEVDPAKNGSTERQLAPGIREYVKRLSVNNEFRWNGGLFFGQDNKKRIVDLLKLIYNRQRFDFRSTPRPWWVPIPRKLIQKFVDERGNMQFEPFAPNYSPNEGDVGHIYQIEQTFPKTPTEPFRTPDGMVEDPKQRHTIVERGEEIEVRLNYRTRKFPAYVISAGNGNAMLLFSNGREISLYNAKNADGTINLLGKFIPIQQ